MDDRDLLNMLRHAFLFGFNAGVREAHGNLDNPDFDSDDRDKDLKSLIEDYKLNGWEGYNDDNGSHVCDSECAR